MKYDPSQIRNEQFGIDPATATVMAAGIVTAGAIVKSVVDSKLQEGREIRKENRDSARQQIDPLDAE